MASRYDIICSFKSFKRLKPNEFKLEKNILNI